MKIDWKSRLTNKYFWLGILSIVALIGNTTGLYTVPENIKVEVNAVLGILGAMGVIVDNSSPGISDK